MTRQPERPGLSPVAAIVRRADPDRFTCGLFAPPDRREAVLLLAAVNHELARAWEVTSVAPLALIRLHWWREIAAPRQDGGARRAHEIAGPLGEAIDAGVIDPDDIRAMVDAREIDEVPDFATWEVLVRGTAGTLATAQARVLGADAAATARIGELGAAYGAIGQLRSIAALARRDRCLLPLDLLAEVGMIAEDVTADPRDPRLAPVRARIADWARMRLSAGAGTLPRTVIAAGLPGVLARRDLHRLGSLRAGMPRGAGDRLAVLAAYLRGTVR